MANKVWLGTSDTIWDTSGNWSPANEPAALDNVYFNQLGTGASGMLTVTSVAGALALLQIDSSFVYAFGTNGTPALLTTTLLKIGLDSQSSTSGTGTGRINIDLSTTSNTTYIYSSASSSTDSNKAPIRLKCNNTATVFHILGGRVGVATDSVGDTATLATINMSGSGSVLYLGEGTTLATLYQSNGTSTLYAGPTTITHEGGSLVTDGVFSITTFNASATAEFRHRRTPASITTLTWATETANALKVGHGLATGDWVVVSGADQSAYNGIFKVRVVDADNFAMAVAGNPTSPATGTILWKRAEMTTLNLYEGADVDVSDNSSDFGIAQVNVYGDATIRVNPANPNQLLIGAKNTVSGTLTIVA